MSKKANNESRDSNQLTQYEEFNATLEEMNAEHKQCRICLEADQSKAFIQPCKCSGSVKYVHESCLKEWIQRSKDEGKKVKCQICKYTIEFQVEVETRCRTCEQFQKKVCSLPQFFAFFIIIILFCGSFMGFLLYLLGDSVQTDQLTMKIVILAISAAALLFIIILTGIKMGQQFCVISKEIIGKVRRCKNVVTGGSKARIFPQTIIVDLD